MKCSLVVGILQSHVLLALSFLFSLCSNVILSRCKCLFMMSGMIVHLAKLVYINSFLEGVQEACTVRKPLVKVLHLVNQDKVAMGYLYEAMDRAKEPIQSYYVGKGTLKYEKYMKIWDLIDSRWTEIPHCPFMQ
jgi:hypothetical protein